MKIIYTLGHSISVVALLVAIAILVALRFAISITCSRTFAASPLPTVLSPIPCLVIQDRGVMAISNFSLSFPHR